MVMKTAKVHTMRLLVVLFLFLLASFCKAFSVGKDACIGHPRALLMDAMVLKLTSSSSSDTGTYNSLDDAVDVRRKKRIEKISQESVLASERARKAVHEAALKAAVEAAAEQRAAEALVMAAKAELEAKEARRNAEKADEERKIAEKAADAAEETARLEMANALVKEGELAAQMKMDADAMIREAREVGSVTGVEAAKRVRLEARAEEKALEKARIKEDQRRVDMEAVRQYAREKAANRLKDANIRRP
jgi:hypothetical protein